MVFHGLSLTYLIWRLVMDLISLILDILTVQFHTEFDVYMILAHSYMTVLHIVFSKCN